MGGMAVDPVGSLLIGLKRPPARHVKLQDSYAQWQHKSEKRVGGSDPPAGPATLQFVIERPTPRDWSVIRSAIDRSTFSEFHVMGSGDVVVVTLSVPENVDEPVRRERWVSELTLEAPRPLVHRPDRSLAPAAPPPLSEPPPTAESFRSRPSIFRAALTVGLTVIATCAWLLLVTVPVGLACIYFGIFVISVGNYMGHRFEEPGVFLEAHASATVAVAALGLSVTMVIAAIAT